MDVVTGAEAVGKRASWATVDVQDQRYHVTLFITDRQMEQPLNHHAIVAFPLDDSHFSKLQFIDLRIGVG